MLSRSNHNPKQPKTTPKEATKMGKKKAGKKTQVVVPATEAMAVIDKCKEKIGEHQVLTTVGLVNISVKEQVSGLTGEKQLRGNLKFCGISIGKMALKALLDLAGRAAGETPSTRRSIRNKTYQAWLEKHPENAVELGLSEELVEEVEVSNFSDKQLATKVKLKAFKKSIKKCSAMFDQAESARIIEAAFGDSKRAKVADIVEAMGDVPASDIEAVFSPLV